MEDQEIDNLNQLQKKLDYYFHDTSLLGQAITHCSYVNEHANEKLSHNERLEFLGDSVLNLILTDRLIKKFPELPEGKLSKIRAGLVNEGQLASLASELRLGSHLLMGRGEEMTGGRSKSSILANTLEAVLGAIYIDGGFDGACKFLDRLFQNLLKDQECLVNDFKTLLQEYCQGKLKITPVYNVFREEGPDHKKTFFVEVKINDQVVSWGEGKTKKEAQQKAAEKALIHLKTDFKGWEINPPDAD